MVYSGWITLVVISLWVSLAAFIWATKSGQFSDQRRARYLALSDGASLSKPNASAKLPIEAYVLLSIFILGVLTLAGTAVFSLFHR